MSEPGRRARLRPLDTLRLAVYGLRSRPLRSVLSALGICIGIAAMVAVVGISTSSRAELNRLLETLGTNLLTAAPGTSFFGEQAILPAESIAMIDRIEAVQAVSAVGQLRDVNVYRHDRIPAVETSGIGTYPARLDLLETVGGSVAQGTWLNGATAQYPAVVLGSRTADRLGISSVNEDVQVWLGGRWFSVVGILEPVTLVPALDTGAFVGWPATEEYLGRAAEITTLFVRADPGHVEAVRELLARTANPAAPNEVNVSRPSDALAAEAAADVAFTGLLLGLGAVALLVGGIGVANTMVISVLERRSEIGLRRALGATRRHIGVQFLAEAVVLSVLGGVAGLLLGSAVTAGYAGLQGWPFVVPAWVIAGGIGATMLIGAIAGLYPAARAARVSPTDALATP